MAIFQRMFIIAISQQMAVDDDTPVFGGNDTETVAERVICDLVETIPNMVLGVLGVDLEIFLTWADKSIVEAGKTKVVQFIDHRNNRQFVVQILEKSSKSCQRFTRAR